MSKLEEIKQVAIERNGSCFDTGMLLMSRTFPILFLDFDGVLNHVDCWKGDHKTSDTDILDPVCVSRLNRIIEKTKCEVVVSSSWRILKTLIELQDLLSATGYKHRLLSTTPKTISSRGSDIHRWISYHGRLNFGPIAIVDDDSNMAPYMDRLVKTDFYNGGLQDEHVEKIIKLLSE